ncbi:hypothetical protein C8J57DRAFT_1039562, partial [Mycena rebaudengoi]
ERFWRRHCFAVALIRVEPGTKNSGNSRKVATCKRCNNIMYPGPPKSPQNHNKGHCSDGFKHKLTEGEFATWPQPATIFTTGSQFHPLPFLGFIREVDEKGVDPSCSDLTMEEEAFLSMLEGPGRVIQSND